jgi:c-di-GMP-related signal transduction protein
MKIETKYNIGDKVIQTRYEDEPDPKEVTEIIIDDDGLSYKLDSMPTMYLETELKLI